MSGVVQLFGEAVQPWDSYPARSLGTWVVPPHRLTLPAPWPDSAGRSPRPWKVTTTRLMSVQQMVQTGVSEAGHQPRVTLSLWDRSVGNLRILPSQTVSGKEPHTGRGRAPTNFLDINSWVKLSLPGLLASTRNMFSQSFPLELGPRAL